MEISAKTRDLTGRKVKQLRSRGLIPAAIYSGKSSLGEKSVVNISLDLKNFIEIYAEAGETSIVTVVVDNKSKYETLIHEIQVDPITLSPIHVGLFEVDLTQTIDTNVPVEIINEEIHEKVKSNEAIIIRLLEEIEVRSLPNNIPSKFEIDSLQLKEIGDVLTIKDSVRYDKSKVEILTDIEEVVVKLDYAEQRVTETEEPVSVDSVEVIKEKAPETEEETKDSKKDTTDAE